MHKAQNPMAIGWRIRDCNAMNDPSSLPNTNRRHERIDPSTSRAIRFRGPFSELYRFICWAYLKLSGWRIMGDWPADPKLVVVAAPHTSNWDGINMLAAAGYYRVKLRWMGKKELTTGPLGFIVKWFGCVPVERKGNTDIVRQMKDAFDQVESMMLAVAPEGTRAKTREWKTGFYHIAHMANVPLLISVLDYGRKEIRLSGVLETSGDYEADFAEIRAHYDGAKGLDEGKFTVSESH